MFVRVITVHQASSDECAINYVRVPVHGSTKMKSFKLVSPVVVRPYAVTIYISKNNSCTFGVFLFTFVLQYISIYILIYMLITMYQVSWKCTLHK